MDAMAEQSVAGELISPSYGHDIDITVLDLCGNIGDISLMARTADGNSIYIGSDDGGIWAKQKVSLR